MPIRKWTKGKIDERQAPEPEPPADPEPESDEECDEEPAAQGGD